MERRQEAACRDLGARDREERADALDLGGGEEPRLAEPRHHRTEPPHEVGARSEARLGHAERPEELLVEDLAEGPLRALGAPHHLGHDGMRDGDRVVHPLAGHRFRRRGARPCDQPLDAREVLRRKERHTRRDAARVGEEVKEGHPLLATGAELGNQLRDRHREAEVAALDAVQHDGVRELLADGHRREDRVGLEAPAPLAIREAAGGRERDLTGPHDAERRAVVSVGLDVGIEQADDVLESFRMKAELAWIFARHGR